jgi:hypothetical protein
MSESQKRIIEVNGVKMEVDLRQAKRVEEYKIGTRVKALIKEYQAYKSYPGVIVGFDDFEKLPTIIVAYVQIEYSKAEVKFLYYNEKTEDAEITFAQEVDLMDDGTAVASLNREIETKQKELQDLIDKKEYFLRHFNQYFPTDNEKSFVEKAVASED